MLAADITTLATLFAEDMLWIHGTSRADTKAGVLASIESRKTIYQSIDCSEETVRCYGETALVSGLVNVKALIAGEERLLANRFTIVWACIGGQWQVVNWQSTTVRKPTA